MASLSCNSGAYTLVGAVGVIAWTLAAASGSYAVTGTTAGTKYGHPITAVSGSYTITGTAIQTRRITAEPAGYILNGQAVTLRYSQGSKVVSAVSGVYAITGTTTQKLEYAQPYTKGQYSLTGSIVALLRSVGPRFSVASGSYAITGGTTHLSGTVGIDSGDYSITGTDVTFRKGKRVASNSGVYSITGPVSTRLEQSRHFPVASGTYAITGSITTLRYSGSHAIFMVINTTPYALTGTDATLLMARRLTAVSGSYTISDSHTQLSPRFTPGSYQLTGSDVTFVQSTRVLTATPGSYSITGIPVTPRFSIVNLSVDSGSYSISGPLTFIVAGRYLPIESGHYSIDSADLTLRATHLNADSGSYSITGLTDPLSTTHSTRWKAQPVRTASSTRQPSRSNIWDTQSKPPGV